MGEAVGLRVPLASQICRCVKSWLTLLLASAARVLKFPGFCKKRRTLPHLAGSFVVGIKRKNWRPSKVLQNDFDVIVAGD